MTKRWFLLLAMTLVSGPLAAEPPEQSPRPVLRPSAQLALVPPQEPQGSDSAPLRSPRPKARQGQGAEAVTAETPIAPGGVALTSLQRPVGPKPPSRRKVTAPAQSMKGAVCGDPGIRGVAIAPIRAESKSCGLEDGVEITAIDGISLSMAATIDCPTASALALWVRKAAIPVVGKTGGGLAGLQVAAHYACRPRNNQPGARMSEHGKGRAIDISGLQLADGTVITVLEGWRQKRAGRILRALHKAACGPFGTVLGPESDRHHQDHLHFDTARYRKGSYCR